MVAAPPVCEEHAGRHHIPQGLEAMPISRSYSTLPDPIPRTPCPLDSAYHFTVITPTLLTTPLIVIRTGWSPGISPAGTITFNCAKPAKPGARP